MRFWRYVEPGENDEPVFHTFSEDEILREYKPYWETLMRKVHKEDLINDQNCLEDWIVVHWAWEVESKDAPNPPRPEGVD